MSVTAAAVQLLAPREEGLAQYVDALRRGWSPDNVKPAQFGGKESLRYRLRTLPKE